MSAKKKAKRPPREVWIIVNTYGHPGGWFYEAFPTRAAAQDDIGRFVRFYNGARVVGPYVLAERAREQ